MSRGDGLGHLHVLFFGDAAKLLHDADVELAHPLFGDAKHVADFLQRHWLAVAFQPVAKADDLALTRIEIFEQAIHLSRLVLRYGQHFVLVAAVIGGPPPHPLLSRYLTLPSL